MMKFTYQYSNEFPLVEVTIASDSTVGEVLEAFQGFLTAAGYNVNGLIDVVETDDEAFGSKN